MSAHFAPTVRTRSPLSPTTTHQLPLGAACAGAFHAAEFSAHHTQDGVPLCSAVVAVVDAACLHHAANRLGLSVGHAGFYNCGPPPRRLTHSLTVVVPLRFPALPAAWPRLRRWALRNLDLMGLPLLDLHAEHPTSEDLALAAGASVVMSMTANIALGATCPRCDEQTAGWPVLRDPSTTYRIASCARCGWTGTPVDCARASGLLMRPVAVAGGAA